ncbi:MAG: hypothetical protein GY861_00940 [bacterium]|nr:hypothetical protein [bacterium]
MNHLIKECCKCRRVPKLVGHSEDFSSHYECECGRRTERFYDMISHVEAIFKWNRQNEDRCGKAK